MYDVLRKYNFQMKATLMWIINNFHAYRMVYGWRMHEKLAYPYWMKNNKGFTLTNGGKISFFFIITDSSC